MGVDLQLVERLIAHGYVPLPTKGKVWIDKYRDQSLRFMDSAPDPDITRAAFRENANAGVSVSAPYIRGTNLRLLPIDIDVYDPILAAHIISLVTRIIGKPCPMKMGQKGATLFCTYQGNAPQLKTAYKNRRGNVVSLNLSEGRINGPLFAGVPPQAQGIDLIGAGSSFHSVLPPSIHPYTNEPYQWLPYPGTDVILRLEDTPPDQLPCLNDAQLMLLTLVFQSGTHKIWEFIGATSPGDFNNRMVEGTLALHHEFFTVDEILWLALREAQRDPPDATTYREREASIRGAVLKLPKKFPEQKSATSRRGPRVPPDREQAEWLMGELGIENCASFNGAPFMWDGQHWVSMQQAGHQEPMTVWYRKVFTAFPQSNHNSIKAALRAFVSIMPQRLPSASPDLIPFSNGVLHVPTMKLRPEERDDNFVGHLPHQFNPVLPDGATSACPKWDIFIRDLTLPPASLSTNPVDHQRATDLVEEYLGYCLTRSYRLRFFMLLIGRTTTGKSVFTKVLKGLLPPEWITEVSLERFGDTNSLRRMANSLVNVSSEAGRVIFTNGIDDVIQRMTSGESVEIKTLYFDSIDVALPARLIINGNSVPDFRDATGALEQRMLLIRTTDIIPHPLIPAFELALLEEAQGILVKLVSAYRRLLARDAKFLLPDYSSREAAETTRTANSAIAHFNFVLVPAQDKYRTSNEELYANYRAWCELNGMKAFSSIQWGKILTGLGHPTIKARVLGGYAYLRELRIDPVAAAAAQHVEY